MTTPADRAEAHSRYQRRQENEALSHSHVCAECGAPLVLATNPPGEPRLFCGQDRGHQGWRKPRYRRSENTVSLPDGREVAVTRLEKE